MPLLAIHRDVGPLEDLVGALAGLRDDDACGERRPERRRTRLEVLAEAVQGRLGFVGGDVDEEDRELVAADPRELVALPQDDATGAGEGAEDVVAARMAVRVVHLLEAVEVEERDDDAPPSPLPQLVPEEGEEVGSLWEAGDGVGGRFFEGALEEGGGHEDRADAALVVGSGEHEVERRDADVDGATEGGLHRATVLADVLEEHARGVLPDLHPEEAAEHVRVRLRAAPRRFGDETVQLVVGADAVDALVVDELPRVLDTARLHGADSRGQGKGRGKNCARPAPARSDRNDLCFSTQDDALRVASTARHVPWTFPCPLGQTRWSLG